MAKSQNLSVNNESSDRAQYLSEIITYTGLLMSQVIQLSKMDVSEAFSHQAHCAAESLNVGVNFLRVERAREIIEE